MAALGEDEGELVAGVVIDGTLARGQGILLVDGPRAVCRQGKPCREVRLPGHQAEGRGGYQGVRAACDGVGELSAVRAVDGQRVLSVG